MFTKRNVKTSDGWYYNTTKWGSVIWHNEGIYKWNTDNIVLSYITNMLLMFMLAYAYRMSFEDILEFCYREPLLSVTNMLALFLVSILFFFYSIGVSNCISVIKVITGGLFLGKYKCTINGLVTFLVYAYILRFNLRAFFSYVMNVDAWDYARNYSLVSESQLIVISCVMFLSLIFTLLSAVENLTFKVTDNSVAPSLLWRAFFCVKRMVESKT